MASPPARAIRKPSSHIWTASARFTLPARNDRALALLTPPRLLSACAVEAGLRFSTIRVRGVLREVAAGGAPHPNPLPVRTGEGAHRRGGSGRISSQLLAVPRQIGDRQ